MTVILPPTMLYFGGLMVVLNCLDTRNHVDVNVDNGIEELMYMERRAIQQ